MKRFIICFLVTMMFCIAPALADTYVETYFVTMNTHIREEYTYTIQSDGTVMITGFDWDVTMGDYSYNIGYPRFPDSIKGRTVTAIGARAFANERDLYSFYLPDTITYIGSEAFSGCKKLDWFTIPENVTYIGSKAFSGCPISDITIPAKVQTIDGNPFYNCSSLRSINVSANNQAYADIDGVLFAKRTRTLVSYPAGASRNYTIPDGIREIADNAFASAGVWNVTCPQSLLTIGKNAFSNCKSLTSISMGNQVTQIGDGAFSDCKSLSSVKLPDSLTSIGKDAFLNCKLTSVTLPNTLKTIGTTAFSMDSLTRYVVAADHPYFKEIDGILFSKDGKKLLAYPAGRAGTAYTVPDTVTTITEGSFASLRTGMKITVPASVSTIGKSAFDKDVSLIVTRNSKASQYATQNKLDFEYENNLDWLTGDFDESVTTTAPTKTPAPRDYSKEIKKANAHTHRIALGSDYILALTDSGIIKKVGNSYGYSTLDVDPYHKKTAKVAAGYRCSLLLLNNGTVKALGYTKDIGACKVDSWQNIIDIALGGDAMDDERAFTVGLKSNGNVVAVGNNTSGQCNVSKWRNIVGISAGRTHTLGLKSDGTVVATGDYSGTKGVDDWRDIIAIAAGDGFSIGLKADGTVVCNQYNVSSWKNITQIAASSNYALGLRKDGTVVVVGEHPHSQSVRAWRNIIAIHACAKWDGRTLGIQSDGHVVLSDPGEHTWTKYENEYLVDHWKLKE